jgi:periplasmic protein TonB
MKTLAILILCCFSINASAQLDSAAVYANTRDTVGAFTEVEVEAAYPGGLDAWKHFLINNINPSRAVSDVPRKVKKFQQTAIVQFIVCKDGSLCEIKVINDVIPSVRREAEEAIRKSGRWEPAVQNGRTVKAYRRQPITFVMQ